MRTETKIILFLLLLSPMLGEVLTGSTPLIEILNPIGFMFLVLLYGCGTLLIREAKVRWGLQWSVIFLAVAYGILEEGTMIQSFFNLFHADLGNLSGYGMYLGVQWPWTIMLILFHGTISTLVPVAMAGMLWPEYKDKPLLKKKGLVFTFIGLIFVVASWMAVIIGKKLDPAYTNYDPSNFLIISSILVVFALIWLAYKYRESRISTNKLFLFSPFVFGVAGFLFQAVNLFLPSVLADAQISGIIAVLAHIILTIIVLLFVVYQIYNKNVNKRHIVSLIFGLILFWIFMTPVIGILGGLPSLIFVGIISLILLIAWRRVVLKKIGLPGLIR